MRSHSRLLKFIAMLMGCQGSPPLPAEDPASKAEEVSVFNVAQVQALPVTFQQIRSAPKCDPVLSHVATVTYARTGWPE